MWESDRVKNIPFSGIRKIFEQATILQEKGYDVIHLELGRPDFDTPIHIKEAAKKSLDEGFVHYVSNYGFLPLRKLIAEKMAKENNVEVDPAKEVLVTAGATEAIYLALSSTLNPGDEILVSDPSWVNYFNLPRLIDVRVKTYHLNETNNFKPEIEQIESLIGKKTRMIIINSPNNPAGSILEEEELMKMAQLAIDNNLLVLSDEVYEKLIYDDVKHVSIASIKEVKNRVITVNSFSKTYSMTGWRLGYVIASPSNIDSMVRIHQQVTASCCSFGQVGAIAALSGPQTCVNNMVIEFERRRNLVVEKLNKISGIKTINPRGAFYAYPNISETGLSGEEFATKLLELNRVATVPGIAFGQTGKDYIRLSYANSYEKLADAMERIHDFVSHL